MKKNKKITKKSKSEETEEIPAMDPVRKGESSETKKNLMRGKEIVNSDAEGLSNGMENSAEPPASDDSTANGGSTSIVEVEPPKDVKIAEIAAMSQENQRKKISDPDDSRRRELLQRRIFA